MAGRIMRAALALSIVFWSGAAIASGPCRPTEAVIEDATARGIPVQPLFGDAARRAVDIYNDQPPASNERWTFAALAELPGGGIIMVGEGTMICSSVQIRTLSKWRQALRVILGTEV